ncbi:MAG: oligoendopeptidase F [Lachnospiraceae bacterium]|nr:oligoendopeptidase F [Lachnospiraceae bacterium]
MKKRNEIAAEDTWKLEDMLESDEAWEELFARTKEAVKGFGQWKGRLGESADQLCRCLQFDDERSRDLEVLYVYARMRSDQDTGCQKYQEMFGRAQSLSYEAAERSSYLIPEILELPEEKLEAFMQSDNGIRHFKRVLEQIIQKKPHTLSGEMEELLAQSFEATQGASRIFNMFNNADVKFPTISDENGDAVTITHGNFIALMESSDRRVRENAFFGLYQVYRQYQNTIAAIFSANVKQAVYYGKVKKYPSSRAYYLAENEVPERVYDNLVSAVRSRLPLLHRYVKIRREALGLDEIHMYDLYVPMVEGVNRSYSFEEAKAIVKEGLAPLGEAYRAVLQEGFDSRWIDVYENEGKRSGAYSWGAYGTHPYVLLNYHGTLDHVFTLAHEMGHAIHSYYSDRNQPYTYAGYKIFVAEVASTCNEALLIRHLMEKTRDPKEKKYLINHFLESFRGTLFRQTMFAEFEAMVHRKAEAGETLTASELCRIYHELNVDYFGPEMVVDDEIDYEWERIPHFYTPFYVYQYATGFSAAVAISSRILKGEPGALEGYQRFLSSGCTMPPIELLKLAGVDMSSSRPVEDALDVFGELLDEFQSQDSEKTSIGK